MMADRSYPLEKSISYKVEKELPAASFTRDHTPAITGTGIIMIVSAFIAIGFGEAGAFSITALVWGSLLSCVAAFFRSRATDKQLRQQQLQMGQELAKERIKYQESVVRHLLSHGLPTGMSIENAHALIYGLVEKTEEEHKPERRAS